MTTTLYYVAHDMDLAGAVCEYTGDFVRFAEPPGANRMCNAGCAECMLAVPL